MAGVGIRTRSIFLPLAASFLNSFSSQKRLKMTLQSECMRRIRRDLLLRIYLTLALTPNDDHLWFMQFEKWSTSILQSDLPRFTCILGLPWHQVIPVRPLGRCFLRRAIPPSWSPRWPIPRSQYPRKMPWPLLELHFPLRHRILPHRILPHQSLNRPYLLPLRQ
jgi:hypothetical protein